MPGITNKPQDVIVIGGGIAGIAASIRLAEYGFKVTLIEKRALLGGRAGSFPLREPGASAQTSVPTALPGSDTPGIALPTPDLVDNCQHVLMRCCVNLLDLYERIGATDAVEFFDRFEFVDRQGRWSTLGASRFLPAPMQLVPSLFRFQSMSVLDKVGVAYGMARLLRMSPEAQGDHTSTFGAWLRKVWQTPNAIECFWRPVVVSALNEEPDRTAAAYGFQLFRQAFLRSRRAYEMGLPRTGLADIYSSAGSAALDRLGARVLSPELVRQVVIQDGRVTGVLTGSGLLPASIVVSAAPYDALLSLLDPQTLSAAPFNNLSRFESSPITGIHLWFDRPVTDKPHAALLGREMQWIFNKSGAEGSSCLGLVVSASRNLTDRPKAEIIALAVEAVHEVFPESRAARIVREVVIREKRATFSPGPGVEAIRPDQRTPITGLYLAGDWTRTGWPATMEGAVRGGYLAAGAVLQDQGINACLLREEMKADRLSALLGL